MRLIENKLTQMLEGWVTDNQIVDMTFDLMKQREKLTSRQVTKRLDEIERVVKMHPYYKGER